jgi:plasmid maintenance system antidote protein VapI
MSRAESFRAGSFLEDELDARGMTPAEFALASGIDVFTVVNIFEGIEKINESTAQSIGNTLGTSADMWINLQEAEDKFNPQD